MRVNHLRKNHALFDACDAGSDSNGLLRFKNIFISNVVSAINKCIKINETQNKKLIDDLMSIKTDDDRNFFNNLRQICEDYAFNNINDFNKFKGGFAGQIGENEKNQSLGNAKKVEGSKKDEKINADDKNLNKGSAKGADEIIDLIVYYFKHHKNIATELKKLGLFSQEVFYEK